MNFSKVFDTKHFSFGIGDQADLLTEATEWEWLSGVHMPLWTFEVLTTEDEGAVASRGATKTPYQGRKVAKLAIKARLPGQPSDYDPTSDSPEAVGIWKLLEKLGGEAALTYAATNVSTATDANTISCATTAKLGCFVAWGTTSLVTAGGFCESLSGSGPYAVQLAHDLAALPAVGNARLPSLTWYPAAGSPTHQSVRICGEKTEQDYRFIGIVIDTVTFAPEADGAWWATISTTAYGGFNDTEDDGGLKARTNTYHALAPRFGASARDNLASNLITDLDDATADDGTCGLKNLSIVWEPAKFLVDCPTAYAGVGDVVYLGGTCKVSFAVPLIPGYRVDSENLFQRLRRTREGVQFTTVVGDIPGRGFAFRMARGVPEAFPNPSIIEGILHQPVTLVADDNTSDGAATDAGNKVFSISLF